MLLDNKTKDEPKKPERVGKLLSLVNSVIVQNGGQPYTGKFLAELKVTLLLTRYTSVLLLSKYVMTISLFLFFYSARGYWTPRSTSWGWLSQGIFKTRNFKADGPDAGIIRRSNQTNYWDGIFYAPCFGIKI